jgi:alanine dehydrogenase
MQSGATAIAYETVTDDCGGLPLLTPMSEIAGRLAVQVGAQALLNPSGGRGVLMGGIPGVQPADVLILGGGVAGAQAADVAIGMGASVCVMDRSLPRLRELAERFQGRVETLSSSPEVIEERVRHVDLVIGTVLVPGAAAPKLVTRAMVRRMRRGSVLVDVSIDQGGCFETSRPTTHDDPTFVLDGVVHYAVANMPGAVAATATAALTNVTLPFVEALCDHGWPGALAADEHLRDGLNVYAGKVHHPVVARAIGVGCQPWSPPEG